MKNKMLTNLVNKLIEKKLTISCCESLTGGLFAAEIVKISGASNTFRGGYVTYQDIAKEILLPNAKEVLEEVGAISEKMAILMAETVKNQLKTNIAVSFTGNAGPISSENKEVGLVYIGIIFNDNRLNPKAVGRLNTNIVIDTIMVVFLRGILVSDIVNALKFSNTAIIVVKAAIDKNKKNNAPIIFLVP